MRTIAAALATALLTAVGAAQAGGVPSVSLNASAFKVFYGHKVTLAGRISTGQAGRHVAILAHRYGTSSPVRVTTVMTRSGGHFSFNAKPSIATSYSAAWAAVHSRSLTIGVQPKIQTIEAGDGRVWVQVSPVSRFTNKSVKLQQLV